MNTLLELEEVSATIANVAVLRGISVHLQRGSTVAVVGRNGAGKTTLLRLLMGFVPRHGGRVRFAGQDLAQVPARRRAALGIGYAPEDRVLFPNFSVEENLRFPCTTTGMARAAIAERLAQTLAIVPELQPLLARSGAALSGGQGKMVALGRAIMAGERLVLLDEPFQGLAPVLAQQYGASLQRLQQQRPELCVLVTESNRSLLKDIPDVTLVLERGAITN
ncbi:ABC transporter ATP-binding protein [Pseudorhodoferax sp.]|uniref:ABC transporter ATP-binding protein n=1 Tax=Pseudorhodoferax sp. TaxID=1993553 RepID=UPI002DD644B4|nr:ATP-binding cassette domain-containing protein [Pseudorhodoferax sp.]